MAHNTHTKVINIGILTFIILKLRNLKLFRRHLFSIAVKIMLFISDAQYYVPINCVEWWEAYIYLKLQEH